MLAASAGDQVTHLYTASTLFSVFLRNVRVAEQTITSLTLGKVRKLMAATEEILGKLMTLVATETLVSIFQKDEKIFSHLINKFL